MIKHIFRGVLSALALCGTVIAGPSREELKALLQNPTSDWLIIFPYLNKELAPPKGKNFTDEEGAVLDKQSVELDIMRELADIDAIGYSKTHPMPEDMSEAVSIGKATAFRHNLIGGSAVAYSGFFGSSVISLYKQ